MKFSIFIILLLSAFVFGCWQKEPWENFCIWVSDAYYILWYENLLERSGLQYDSSIYQKVKFPFQEPILEEKTKYLYTLCMENKEYEYAKNAVKNYLIEDTPDSIRNGFLYCFWFSDWASKRSLENDTWSGSSERFINRSFGGFELCLKEEQYNKKLYAHTLIYK